MTLSPLTLALLLAANGDVVARVDGVPISRDSLGRQMDALRSRGRPAPPEAVLEALVGETLLANEARRLGLERSPDVAASVQAEARRVAAGVLVQRIAESTNFDDETLRGIFHSTSDHVSYEFVVLESQEAALATRRRLDQGGTLAAEVKHAVVSETYAKPEKAPPRMRGQIEPRLAEALFAARPAQIVGPVELKTGWIVARLVRKQIGTEEEFGARRQSLVGFARQQAAGAARGHVIEQMKAKTPVTIDEPFLGSIQGTEATAAQMERVVATVGGRQLRYRDIYPTVRSIAGGTGHMAGPAVKVQIARKEVENLLLQEAAVDKGLEKDPLVLARKADLERAVLARAAIAALQSSASPPSEEEIGAFYRRNATRYGRRFEEVLPRVAADAAAQKRQEALAARLQELRKNASVEIDRAALKAVNP